MSCGHRGGCPRIEYGDLILHECDGPGPYSIVADGFNLGRAVTVYEAVKPLIDGSFQSSPGHSNREGLSFGVMIDFSDSQEFADLAEALELEAGKATNEFRFYPGDDGPVTVLETFAADGGDGGWDIFQDINGYRVYPLTIPALPFARALSETTLEWDEIGTNLDTLAATTGWSSSGSAPTPAGPDGLGRRRFDLTSGTTYTKTFTIDRDFLWVWSRKDSGGSADGRVSALSGVSIDGVAVPSSLWSPDTSVQTLDDPVSSTDRGAQRIIDVSAWRGQTVAVALTFTGGGPSLWGLWTLDYPSLTQWAASGGFGGNSMFRPVGLGVIDVPGSARTPVHLSFTVPSGGAFVITTPDPVTSLRTNGAAEVVWGHVTVASGYEEIAVGNGLIVLPDGEHAQSLGTTNPQPVALNPDGIWPQVTSGSAADLGTQVSFPFDARASVTFLSEPGATHIIAPTPQLPEGYVMGALAGNARQSFHPGRCGFAVLDAETLEPIPTTATFYRRNWIYAAG